MNQQLLSLLLARPQPYEENTWAFWADEHISSGMLEAHLQPNTDGATRHHAFVERSVEWISQQLPKEQFPRLMDYGCGPGLYAQRFCQKGYQTSGLDLSARSIAYARQQAEAQGLRIDYQQGDYLRPGPQQAFDLATLIYCGYGVLNQTQRQTLLSNIHAALVPGGRLLLDVFTPKEYRNKPESTSIQAYERGFWYDEPYACIQSFFRYEQEQLFCDRYILITQQGLQCHHLWNQAFTPQQLCTELESAGFEGIELFSDVAGAPYSQKSRTQCAIAKRA